MVVEHFAVITFMKGCLKGLVQTLLSCVVITGLIQWKSTPNLDAIMFVTCITAFPIFLIFVLLREVKRRHLQEALLKKLIAQRSSDPKDDNAGQQLPHQ